MSVLNVFNITAGLRRELSFLAFALLLVLVFGSLTDSTLVLLCINLGVYVLWTLYNLNLLVCWLTRPSKNTPETWGIWGDVYYQLYHLYRRQRKARRKLAKMLKRFQQSTQALPYATIVFNKMGGIEWFNPVAGKLFSLQQGQDIGQRIDNLIRQPEFTRYISMREFESPLEFQKNQQRILLSITPYGGGKLLLSAQNITQRVKLDEMRRDFISNASHELRTPITVMSGYIEMLRDIDNASFNQPLDKIYAQILRMEKIISELIELAKLEASPLADKSPVLNLYKLLDEVYTEMMIKT